MDASWRILLELIRTACHDRLAALPACLSQRVRPTVQRVLDSMSGTPAFVLNGRLDVLAANDLGFAPVLAGLPPTRSGPPNNARFIFLDPHAGGFFRDWDKVANDAVACGAPKVGRDPYDGSRPTLIRGTC